MIGVNSKVFCYNCGNLLDFKFDTLNRITCQSCDQPNNQCLEDTSLNENTIIKNTSKYNTSSIWKNKLYNEIDKFKVHVEGGNKVMIVQDCPNKSCDSKELIQYSLQMRSADEGSTVFSECPKCGIKFTQNN